MSESAGRVLMIPKGTYSPTATYDPLDAVKYGHNSYVCKQTSRGNLPTNTTYWQPLTDVTADEIPTEDSTNLVQSGGVYSALQTLTQTLTNQVKDMNNVYGSKNLLPNARVNTTYGSTLKFVTDEDGIVTVTGNASGNNYFYVSTQQDAKAIPYPFDSVDTKLSGCPSGGSTSGYRMTLVLYSDAEATTSIASYRDIGEGVIVPATPNAYYRVTITIPSGSGYNLTFKPMLRLASITDDTYVPYAKTNKELTDDLTTVRSGILTVDSENADLQWNYSGASANNIVMSFKGFISTKRDATSGENSWINIGTVSKKPKVAQQIACPRTNHSEGTIVGTNISIDTSGNVLFNMREGMKSGDQFTTAGLILL